MTKTADDFARATPIRYSELDEGMKLIVDVACNCVAPFSVVVVKRNPDDGTFYFISDDAGRHYLDADRNSVTDDMLVGARLWRD